MNKIINLLLLFALIIVVPACNAVYKKHYSNGYTFLNHKKNKDIAISEKQLNLQNNTIHNIDKDIVKEKLKEQQKAEQSYRTYHKYLNKIENNASGKFLAGINKLSLKKIDALKADTIYRKEPPKKGNYNSSADVKDKAQLAMIFGIVSLASFFVVWILSLIPAVIALIIAKKAITMAKLSGEEMPSDAKTARLLALISIGLNILSIVLVLLYLLLVIILISATI
jgi:hypothetical protein